MATVQQILKQQDNYSQLSIDASFTLQDILQQPPDQQLHNYQNIQEIDDIDAMFQDNYQEQQQLPMSNSIKQISSQADNSSNNKQILSPSKIQNNINLDGKQNNNKQDINMNKIVKSQIRNVPVRRGARLGDLPIPSNQNIRNMVYISLKNVSQLFDINNSQSKGVGVATCISTSGNKFLALGTSIGNIVIFQIGVKGHRLLSTPDQNKYGQVTSVSVSRDNRYLVAGYQTGLVILWDLYSFKLIKTILLQKNRILKVLFCSQNYQNFVSSDSQGYLYMYTIQNYLWTGVRTQLLIDKSDNIYYDIKYSKVKSGRQILALSTMNSVLLVILKPNVSILGSIQRPQGISNLKIPNCQIGQGQQKKSQGIQSDTNSVRNSVSSQKSLNSQIQLQSKQLQPSKQKQKQKSQKQKQKQQKEKDMNNKQDYLCVSWGRLIYVYILVYSNSQIQKLQNDFIIEQPSGVHNMQFITSGILLTLDSRQVYRVINLAQQKAKIKQNSNSKKVVCSCISISQLAAQTIYQRYLKDKQGKYIKSYSNTIVSCCHNPRYKQVFFISKNAVFRGRLEKWTDYIHYLLTQQKNWSLALKICLELYKGNYNIFTQKFYINKNSLNLLCQIGRIFFKERMKQIQKQRTELNSIDQVLTEVKQMFEITIQYFCTIDCQDLMFTSVYKDIKEKYFFKYQQVFIQCLQPFIEQSLLNKIPNRQTFIKIIQAYSKKPELLNKLIISLHEDSLYFQDIVQICTKQKLFQSLSYICSVNGDFISPANKLIAHLQQYPSDQIQYKNLKQYLTNLIQFKYPNSKPITKNTHKNTMLRDISIWLVCDETLQYMIKNYEQDYFIILANLGNKLLQNQQINQIPVMIEQVISKLDIIKQFKLLPKFMEFVMNIGLSFKIHYSQELVRKILDSCVEIFQKYNTADLRKEFKYVMVLRFLEKYLLDKHDNTKQIRQQYQSKLLPKLNIWIRLTYKMLSQIDKQQLLKQSPQLLKNQDPGRDAALGYLFINSQQYQQIIHKYQDLLIQWSPQQSLLYIIQTNKKTSIKQINNNVIKIQDQKLRYAVIRKILRILRVKNKQSLNQPNKYIGKILKASIKQLHIPQLIPLANTILQTTLSDQILLFYIKSICKYKKQKRVFYQLIQNQQQYRSIVNQLLPIMYQYKYKSCIGFIYEQQYKLKQAFDQYKDIYNQYFEQNFKKLISHQWCHGRFMLKIFYIMLNLCFKIKKQQQWGLLISVILIPLQKQDFTTKITKIRIIDTIQSIYQKKSSRQHPFIQHLIDIIQLTLISTSRQISINLMAIQLNKYTDLLNKSFIVNCLISTLKGCNKRVQIFEISKKLMIKQFINQFQQFYNINKIIGSKTDNICDQCNQQISSRNYNINLQQIKFQILKCGHGYHQNCYKKNYYKCKICTRKAYGDQLEDQNSKDKLAKILKLDKKLIENQMDIKQIQIQQDKSEEIFRYLALEDYRKRQQLEFQNFVQQYQGYIATYKNV